MIRWRLRALLLTLALSAATEGQAQEAIAGGELPPVGYGSLRQDNVSMRLTLSDVELRLLPLDERLLRLMAPDAYQSLRGLVDAHRAEIDSATRIAGVTNPGLLLVSFFGLRSGTQFDPSNVSLVYRNQLNRPLAIISHTANFSSRQLDARASATGLLVFDEPLPVYERFELQYGTAKASWNDDILRRIERERSRVQSRTQSLKPDSAHTRP